ncbi:MAG: helix-hairpin-helix domain-containing protein [Armatimonadota bacterium]
MSLDLGLLFSPGGLLFGAMAGFGASLLIDKFGKKGSASTGDSDSSGKIAELQAQIDANFESQSKVDEVHAYARKLEEKVQQLESTSDSADAQLRVKVLEKQLSEKADLESRLAVALQQLEDYKAKAEMFDTVVGAEPAASVESEQVAETEPMAEDTPEPMIAQAEEVVEETQEEESIAAVASAEPAPEMTVVENDTKISAMASPVGATALAVEERPALRVESNPLNDAKDPLEKIEGIGNIYQTKLYEAGIRTFAQLAAASPSRITEIVEPQNWQTIDIMKWRREAALYAAGEKA